MSPDLVTCRVTVPTFSGTTILTGDRVTCATGWGGKERVNLNVVSSVHISTYSLLVPFQSLLGRQKRFLSHIHTHMHSLRLMVYQRPELRLPLQHSQKVFQYLSLLRVYILKHSETILPVEKGMVIMKYCHLLVRTYHHWALIKPLSSGQKPHRNRTLLIRDYCKDTICYVECWPIRKTKIFITAQPTWASANSLVDDGGYGVTCTLLLACTCITGLHGVLNPITTHLF